MTNRFPGLATGPIDHQSTSVINAISNGVISMGSVVILFTGTLPDKELLPRVSAVGGGGGTPLAYGIAVGGDTDGVYGDGPAAADDTTRATNGADEAVKIVTRGRCPARVKAHTTAAVNTAIVIGDPLTHDSSGAGRLALAVAGQTVIARALQPIPVPGEAAIIAIEVNKEGIL